MAPPGPVHMSEGRRGGHQRWRKDLGPFKEGRSGYRSGSLWKETPPAQSSLSPCGRKRPPANRDGRAVGSGLATAPLPPAARGPGPTWPSLRRGRATPEAGVIPSGRDPGLRTQAGRRICTTWALLRLCSAEAPSTWDPENQVQAPALPLSHSVAEGRASGPEVPTWPRLPVTLCSGSSAWGPGPQPQSLRRGFWCRQLPEGGA